MRIAEVAPLAESAPPKLYGGTERVYRGASGGKESESAAKLKRALPPTTSAPR
jgi:hypothetical protein